MDAPSGSPTPVPAAAPARPLGPFFVLWSSQAVSLLGSAAVQFALIWWLTVETGSAAVLATATLLGLLPPVVLGPVIGALVDRTRRKTVMLVADGSVALASAGLAVAFWLGAARIEIVFVVLLVRALGGAFHSPAMLASTSLMVPEEHLARIQGLNQALQGALLIVAPPLGALLITLLSLAGILMVDVVSALVAIVPLVFLRVPQPAAGAEAGSEPPRLWRDVVAGFRYLGARPGHLGLVTLASVVNLFLVPAFSLLPLLVLEELGGSATQLGWATSAFGVGTLAGGVALGVWGGFRRRILTSLVGLFALGLAVLALALVPASFVAGATLAMVFVGFAAPVVNGPIQAVLQATVAPEYQGRVFTLFASLAGITAPLGLVLAAPVAELVGVRTWYVAGALACLLMGAIGLSIPAIADIERRAERVAGVPELG